MGGYEDDAAWKYVEDLFTNIDGKIIESSSGVYKGVADGEYLVGLSYEAVSYTHLASVFGAAVVAGAEEEEEQPARAAAVMVSAIVTAIVFFIVNPPLIDVDTTILVKMHKK